jgi:hypothetical protein
MWATARWALNRTDRKVRAKAVRPHLAAARIVVRLLSGAAPDVLAPMLTLEVECQCGVLRMRPSLDRSVDLPRSVYASLPRVVTRRRPEPDYARASARSSSEVKSLSMAWSWRRRILGGSRRRVATQDTQKRRPGF